jgi:multiple sugar transport system ATP-binding protein
VQQIGTPQEVFNHPYNLFVAGFSGMPQMNFFDAELKIVDDKYAVMLGGTVIVLSEEKEAALRAKNVAAQQVIMGVRPEHIVLNDCGFTGKVDVCELMGSSVHLHVNSLGRDVVMVVSTMNMTGNEVAALGQGASVVYGIPGHVCHLFDKETGINLEV